MWEGTYLWTCVAACIVQRGPSSTIGFVDISLCKKQGYACLYKVCCMHSAAWSIPARLFCWLKPLRKQRSCVCIQGYVFLYPCNQGKYSMGTCEYVAATTHTFVCMQAANCMHQNLQHDGFAVSSICSKTMGAFDQRHECMHKYSTHISSSVQTSERLCAMTWYERVS